MARSPLYEKGNIGIWICEVVFYPLTRLLGRRRFVNLDKIAVAGPALLVANHVSHLDPLFDTVFVRKTGRWPHVMAKASLFKIPLVGRALTSTQQIPVERTGSGAGQASVVTAQRMLAEGKMVVIYPEGTVTKEPDFWPMRPRPGVAALALSGDFPVIPMVHWGTQLVYNSYAAKGKFRPLPRKDVYVVAGDPIDLSPWRGRPTDARAVLEVSLAIMTAIRDLLAELRGQTPPDIFFDPKKAVRQQKAAGSGTADPQPAVRPPNAAGAEPSTGDPDGRATG